MSKKKKPVAKPDAPPPADGWKGVDIRINAFGEIVKDQDQDAINAFLNEKVPDKKPTDAP